MIGDKQLLIFALSYNVAVGYARAQGLIKKQWRYISGMPAIHGLMSKRIVFLGHYRYRPDYAQVMDYARRAGMEIVTPDDEVKP